MKKNIFLFKQFKLIGDKTADYFKIFASGYVVAINKQLISFLNIAVVKIFIDEYPTSQGIIKNISKLLNLEKEVLEHSNWAYISAKR